MSVEPAMMRRKKYDCSKLYVAVSVIAPRQNARSTKGLKIERINQTKERTRCWGICSKWRASILIERNIKIKN